MRRSDHGVHCFYLPKQNILMPIFFFFPLIYFLECSVRSQVKSFTQGLRRVPLGMG